jgi:hypothetical protein
MTFPLLTEKNRMHSRDKSGTEGKNEMFESTAASKTAKQSRIIELAKKERTIFFPQQIFFQSLQRKLNFLQIFPRADGHSALSDSLREHFPAGENQ